jgi:hypothetical protein
MNDYDATVLSYSASSTICAKEIFWSCGSWIAYRPVPPAGKHPLIEWIETQIHAPTLHSGRTYGQ